MASIGPLTSLRAAVSLACLVAAAQAFPHQSNRREETPFSRDGCFVGSANGNRALSGASYYSDDAMTVESCAAFCSKFKYFGLEYGSQCYCGDAHSAQAAPDSDCSFPCSGNSAQKCGAGDRLDLYTNNLYIAPAPATLEEPYLGCFVDQGARALPDNLLGADDMTAQKCAEHCANYSYFGVEYGRECWCGNSPPNTPAPESECSFRCAGDDSQICGAGNRINVWGSPLPSPETVADFEYFGCFTDKGDERGLRGRVTYDPAMTLEKCASACSGYSYFGVEFGSQCYCGTYLEDSSVERPQAECSMRCGGDYNNVCGDADRLNVFVSNDCKEDPVNPPTVAGFNYQSCWTDSPATRSLTGNEYRSDDMTVESCAAFCQGFSYFGVEYSRECYCGNELGGQAAPEEQCSEICMGNSNQWCGAPERLNVYVAGAAPTSSAAPTATPV
ncbi:WSC domain-containing protein [Madurella fahalii]|uniref:WSC domain-containing protein n=1 Tax=Madurella fahalii TaxID=1157608 RepID=A0ABQ0G0R5_9PEZI